MAEFTVYKDRYIWNNEKNALNPKSIKSVLRKQAEAREKERHDTWAALEYVKVRSGPNWGKIIEEKDRESQAIKQEIEELKRKLREAGVDIP
jgi:hypothetical protein